jgi:hypothetical protein
MKCDHSDGTLVGACAVCGDPVCSECFTSLFNTVICAIHEGLDDEGEWELIAFYTTSGPVDSVRFYLDDHGVQSIAVAGDEEAVELYVPIAEKDDAWALLEGGEAGDEMVRCDECRVYYSREAGECPICGGSEVR